MNIISKRTFWTIAKGTSVGVIEASYKAGFVIHANYINYRETNSKFSSNKTIKLNTRWLSKEDVDRVDRILVNREQVCIEFKMELLSSPLKGEFLGESYITRIK